MMEKMRSLRPAAVLPVAAAAVLLLSGCHTPMKESPTPASNPSVLSQQDRPQMIAVGKLYGQEVLEGMKKGDYKLFTEHFAPAASKQLTPQGFEEVRKQIGTITGSVYLTDLANPLFHSFLWKVSIEKPSADLKSKELIRGEMLLRVTLMKNAENKYEIVGCFFN